MFTVSIPKSATRSALVETATKWSATADSPSASTSQARAVRALVSVSIVPKVFDATTNNVDAGSESASTEATSAPSTFETNEQRMDSCRYARSASYAIAGPRSEPPMPMFTTWRIVPALRTRSAYPLMASSTSCTSGTTFRPSISNVAPRGIRSATWPDGAVLGDVDVFAGEHRVAAALDTRRNGQLHQRVEDGVVDAAPSTSRSAGRPPSSRIVPPDRDRWRTAGGDGRGEGCPGANRARRGPAGRRSWSRDGSQSGRAASTGSVSTGYPRASTSVNSDGSSAAAAARSRYTTV